MRNGKSVGHQRAYQTLGELVGEYCGSHPQEWLANQLGVTSQYINMIINNKRLVFSKRILCQFAVLAKIDIELLAELAGYEITDLLRYFKPAYIMQSDIRRCVDQSDNEISIAQLLRESGEPKRAKSSLFLPLTLWKNGLSWKKITSKIFAN